MNPTFRTLKIDDENALRALVTEHAESLEASLKILDDRVLLGRGAIDLVAVDAAGHLVLIAVAFAADDAMLLRMLEAFAWCVDYPEIVGRLYAASAAAPRVMFVSQRLSDGFLRRLKHLRIPSIDCFEFRYLEVNGVAGLYFNPVDSPRPSSPSAAAEAPVSAAPVSVRRPVTSPPPPTPILATLDEPETAEASPSPDTLVPELVPEAAISEPAEPAVAPAPVVAEEPVAARVEPAEPAGSRPSGELPAELLQGLRMPDNLSSQWRRILSRATNAPDPAKVRIVRDYLKAEFPGGVVHDSYEPQRAAQMFQIQSSQGQLMHAAAVSDSFFEATAEGDVLRFLERQRLGRALRDAGTTSVLMSAGGLRLAKTK